MKIPKYYNRDYGSSLHHKSSSLKKIRMFSRDEVHTELTKYGSNELHEQTVKRFIETSKKKGYYLQKLGKSILNPLPKPTKNEKVYE